MRRGFSLVEMLVTVSLVVLMGSVGFASTLRGNEQKKVTEAAETIRQYYILAKSYALSGKKDCAVCGAAGGVCGKGDLDLNGWVTNLNTLTPSIEIYGECGTGPVTRFFSSGEKFFPARILVTTAGGSGVVRFKPLNNGTNLTNALTVTVSSTLTGIRSKRFTITREGEISAIITL